ncbi:MAG: transcriptional regulator, LysR family [Solirubrobacterales bacterium]|nr:transcriptional regulator, LysR family [Solirubrobacterales bacterium]
MKAAAVELGVSEPSVSGAVAALRRELGDELYVRKADGIGLTPGGRRLATGAAEILGLADWARRAVREARGETAILRVAATATVAETVAPRLLAAFERRNANVEIHLEVAPAGAFSDLLVGRRADVVLGPRPRDDARGAVESVPFLRYAMLVVAAPEHPLAGARGVPLSDLAADAWLVGAVGAEAAVTTSLLVRGGLPSPHLHARPGHATAVAEVAEGRGVMLAIDHAVLDDVERGAVVVLDVDGMPVAGLWHASMLTPDRRTPAAWALRRFVTTTEATQAILARDGRPRERFRPSIRVTPWS